MVARSQGTAADLSDTVFDKSNLTNFSDAVIAIAITLLVLELKFPPIGNAEIDARFLSALYDQAAVLVGYLVGFFVIASLWYSYHRFMKFVVRLDGQTVFLNLLFVFFIAFLPFPTSILGMYPASSTVVAFYGLVIAALGATSYLMRDRAIRSGNLHENADYEVIRSLQTQSRNNALIALASVPVGFISPLAAMLMWICMPFAGRALARLPGRRK